MNAPRGGVARASELAEPLRGRTHSWDLYAESIRRYEVHLNGDRVEMIRGPIALEGCGFREIQPANAGVRIGFAASTDTSKAGVLETAEVAERTGTCSTFPARGISMPTTSTSPARADTVDTKAWDSPLEFVERCAQELLAPLSGRKDVRPSFGSVRLTLFEVSLANSAGVEASYRRTTAEVEFALRSVDGPEGAAAGEYWVNRHSVRLDPRGLGEEVPSWAQKAKDSRTGAPTTSGSVTAVFPPEVLSDILPGTLGFRFSGSGALRGLKPPSGTPIGASTVTIADDGLFPFGLATSPLDDEGIARRRRPLIEGGIAREPLLDLLHARALGGESTGSANRGGELLGAWFRFGRPPSPGATTLVVAPGSAGSDAEIAEAVGDGVWIDQLGYAFPDPVSSTFGGEIRLAYRIRGGKIGEPIRGGTIGAVTLAAPGQPSLLESTRAIGSEPRLFGGLFSPPLAVAGMPVSGR